MSATRHMSLNIRGFLRNARYPRDYRGLFRHGDGRGMTASEARDFLLDELSKGHVVIPFGHCEGFDYTTGCPGHASEAET